MAVNNLDWYENECRFNALVKGIKEMGKKVNFTANVERYDSIGVHFYNEKDEAENAPIIMLYFETTDPNNKRYVLAIEGSEMPFKVIGEWFIMPSTERVVEVVGYIFRDCAI
jgi:hypothetical protein